MDYKNTLNLPKTDFSMKADLPKKEPLILEKWQKQDIYRKILDNSKKSPKYILHDGPPYANGDIHIGHALNKILKDIIIKYKTMRGFYSCYIPGWDCHGLPVEHQLFKELGITKTQISQVEFRKKAYAYAMRYVDIQKEQFKRLGVFGDWENPYLTLSKEYEADIIRAFGKLVKDGYIYKGKKPVNWCYICETALAEAEVEYEDHTSPSVYVKFKLTRGQGSGGRGQKKLYPVPCTLYPETNSEIYFVIWTTTPWTLVANAAIAVHPEHEYAFIQGSGFRVQGSEEVWVMMKDLIGPAMEKFGIKDYKIIKTVRGKELEGLVYKHPFVDRESKVVLADYVSNLDGTGCVHTAPGHGQEDYLTGVKYKLPVIMPVDSKGKFDKTAGELSGVHVRKADNIIIDILKRSGALIFNEAVSHSYPHCWRCKEPIIFRATPQWFMGIDHKDLRKRMLDAIAHKVKWVPSYGRDRISGMVETRPDWCLSRQRFWGVPIAAFYCKACGEELLDAGVIDYVADLVEKEGADVWFTRSEDELLPKSAACKSCGKRDFKKEMDIMDVWFDSGISHQAVLKKRKQLSYPADLYLEGSDQHRGWFQSALITGMGIENERPFKTVLTHGFVVDGEGKKMSKSLGNVIFPQDVMKDSGADILRLWVASSDYSDDIRISDQILTRLADAYRKIRNTYRFILGNLSGFDIKTDVVKHQDMLEIDRWALSEAYKLLQTATKSYEEFLFHEVFHSVYNFCVIQLSSFYLDILKDRLYISHKKSIQRRSGQTALFEILDVITKVMAPILVFTSSEVWEKAHEGAESGSVHLAQWPSEEKFKKFYDKALDEKWARLMKVREEILKALELKREANFIGSSLEAGVVLYSTDEALQALLKQSSQLLPSIFIVSKVEVADKKPEGSVACVTLPLMVKVDKAPGAKCQRCWNYSEVVGKNNSHPSLCGRCVKIVEGEPE